MNIFKATKALAALTKQFSAAGLNIEDFIASADESALQAHIESLKGNSSVSVDVSAVTAAAVKPFESALAKFGAVVKPANAEAGVTEADIEAALNARASIKAADQLAKHGLPAALPLAPAAESGAASAKKELTYSEFSALKPHQKMEFCTTGGRIIGNIV